VPLARVDEVAPSAQHWLFVHVVRVHEVAHSGRHEQFRTVHNLIQNITAWGATWQMVEGNCLEHYLTSNSGHRGSPCTQYVNQNF
jgi:hypothetical protein